MTPLVAWPIRMMVSMPWALRMVSNALPENALVRCLAMTGSPSLGATEGWISRAGSAGSTAPVARMGLRGLCGFVANFAQEVLKGQLPLSRRGLCGQGVELFGRSAALVSGLDDHLFFLDHVYQFDANERGLRRVKRFEP